MIRKLLLLTTLLLIGDAALADGNQYALAVKGVACPYCAYGVEKRLRKIDGVGEVQIDIGASVVRVTMADDKFLTEAQAKTAVEEAGFTLHSFSSLEPATGRNDDE